MDSANEFQLARDKNDDTGALKHRFEPRLGRAPIPWGQCSALEPNKMKVKVKVTQSRLTLCNPMDCSPQGSSVPGILQARILEWVAISSFRGSSQPTDRTRVSALQADSLLPEPLQKPRPVGQFSRSVVSDSLQLMDRSTSGLPDHHRFPEFTQTHVH